MSSKFAPDVPKSLIDAVSSILGEAKVEPAKPDPEAVARKKKLDALRDKQEADKAEKGEDKPQGVRKVAGHAYGGAKQKDDTEDTNEAYKNSSDGTYHNPHKDIVLAHNKELKGDQHKIDANKNGKIDADDFKKLRAMKKEELSPKQKKIAAMAGDKDKIDADDLAALRAGKKPECHTCDEETVDEAAYSAKAARAGKDIGKPGKNFAMIAAKAGKRYGSAESGKKVAGAILAKIRAKHEEVEHIEERELSPAETEKKEKYVKSMKKGLAGFKSRYGDRAKNVMYATATKMAKAHEEAIHEAIVNHEDIAKHLIKKHGKDVSMDNIEDAIDGMDDAHKVDKQEVLHHIKKLTKNEEFQISEGKMKDIFTTMQYHASKKGYTNHKQFTPDDYHEMGKEHGISGQDLAVIAGHKTASQAAKDLPFTPDKPHGPIATAGKHGYGPSAARHLARQGMLSLKKEESVVEGTGGPIYTKPFVKLGDLLARVKDMRNIKKATIVTPKDENQVVMKKEETEQVDETMMGKAGCTSEDDKKKAEKPVDYDKPTFLRKKDDWRKSNPAHLPKPKTEEVVTEGLEDHFTKIPSDVKKKMRAHLEKGDHEAAAKEAHKAGHLLKYHNLVSNAAHSFHQDHDTRHHDITDLHPYMMDYLKEGFNTFKGVSAEIKAGTYKPSKPDPELAAQKKKDLEDLFNRKTKQPDWSKKTEEVEQVDELSNDLLKRYDAAVEKKHTVRDGNTVTSKYPNARISGNRIVGAIRSSKRQAGFKGNTDKVSRADHYKAVRKEEVESIDELDKGTLARYAKKATSDMKMKQMAASHLRDKNKDASDKHQSDAHKRETGIKKAVDKLAGKYHKEEVSIDETATLDKYIRSMGYDPEHLDKNKKVMFAKTNAYKNFASSQKTEGLYDGGQKGTQDIDTHMSPGATARG